MSSYYDLPLEYGLSHSMLELYRLSPFEFWMEYVAKIQKKKVTDEMALGTMLDILLFPSGDELSEVRNLQAAIGEKRFKKIHEKAMKLLFNFNGYFGNYARDFIHGNMGQFNRAERQKIIFWKDPNGVPRKGKLDHYIPGRIIDGKTTKDLSSFKWTAKKFGYHRQAADYISGVDANAAEGEEFPSFYWLVLETEYPWQIKVLRPEPKDIAEGMKENQETAKELWQRIKNNDWDFTQKEPETINITSANATYFNEGGF